LRQRKSTLGEIEEEIIPGARRTRGFSGLAHSEGNGRSKEKKGKNKGD